MARCSSTYTAWNVAVSVEAAVQLLQWLVVSLKLVGRLVRLARHSKIIPCLLQRVSEDK